jgi:hypothetical protein
MIEQHPILFSVFLLSIVFWSVVGTSIYNDSRDRENGRWSFKQRILAFVLAGPIYWLGVVAIIVVGVIWYFFYQIWDSKYLK